MSISIEITDIRQLAGITSARINAGQEVQTDQEFLQETVEQMTLSWRDEFIPDRISSSDFLLRCTPSEFGAVMSAAESDPLIAGLIDRIRNEPYVWLASNEVQQAMGYLVVIGILTEARAGEIASF